MPQSTARYISYGNEASIIARLLAGAVDGTTAWANAVLAEAVSIVPVDTGELRDSGHVEVATSGNIVDASVVFDAAHAMFVEFGTGITGRGTYPYPLPTSGVPITGAWIYDYRNIGWRGMKSQAYLRPAFDANADQAEPLIDIGVKGRL